jgi:hypothetical protein
MLKSKWIFIAILLCVMLPLVANATITRVIGLGGANTNYIVTDASNPQIWPQLVADWPNLAGAEFNTVNTAWDNYKAYLNYSFPNASVVQVSLDNLDGVRSMFYGNPAYTLLPDVPNEDGSVTNTPASKLGVTWGMPLEGGMKIGAALNVAQHSYKDKTTPTANELSATLIGINLGASFLDNKLDAAVGFESVSGSKKPGTGGAEDKTDGSMGLNIAARYWWMYADKMALVPHIQFLDMKDAAKYADNSKDSYTTTDITIGIGHNWTPVENTLAIFEIGADLRNVKDESTPAGGSATSIKYTENSLPYWRIGFETQVFSWLNGRLGAERNWVAESSDDKTVYEPEAAFSQTYTYVGATAHWNRLYLDLLIQPSFFRNGVYFVSGSGAPMFSRVSLKYDFNK